MVETKSDENLDAEKKSNRQSNWAMILLLLFVLLPATAIFVTEIATDKLIYRTIHEAYGE